MPGFLFLVGGSIGVDDFLGDGGRIAVDVLAVAELAWVEVVLAVALSGALGSVFGDKSTAVVGLVREEEFNGTEMRAPTPKGGGGTGVSTFGLFEFGRIGAGV